EVLEVPAERPCLAHRRSFVFAPLAGAYRSRIWRDAGLLAISDLVQDLRPDGRRRPSQDRGVAGLERFGQLRRRLGGPVAPAEGEDPHIASAPAFELLDVDGSGRLVAKREVLNVSHPERSERPLVAR